MMDYVRQALPVPVGYWRSVSSSQNGFFGESMIDECAHAAGVDPIDYRNDMLAKNPRGRAVLAEARRLAGWDEPRQKGHGMGVALNTGFGYSAQIIEVRVDGDQLSIQQVTCAFDCGVQIDPGLIRAQIEGGIVFGLTASLYGKVTLEDGRVQEQNYNSQRLLTLRDTPPIQVALLKADARPEGVGEAGVPGVAPALVNAIFAATGQRIRRLPILAEGFRLA
jgi:CO/xanthine dehydrogenase Mo-binding subunit